MQIKILTYNIHKGRRGHSRRLILDELKAAIDQTGADIVCLQEVQGLHKDIPEPHLERLADQLWQHFAYAQNAVTQKGHHGNAILSRFPIKAHTNTNMAWLKGASRSILEAELEIPEAGTDLRVMCTHMGLLGIERQVQIAALEERIKAIDPDKKLVIAGDFNDWAQAGHNILMRRGDLQELSIAIHGKLARTYPARMPTLTVDRIYVRHLQPVNVVAPVAPHWRHLSDHLPLLGVVSF